MKSPAFVKLRIQMCNKTLHPLTEAAQSAVSALRHPGCAATSSAHLYLHSVNRSASHKSSSSVTLFGKCWKSSDLEVDLHTYQKVFLSGFCPEAQSSDFAK